jgi:S1-C subfamily serine protease
MTAGNTPGHAWTKFGWVALGALSMAALVWSAPALGQRAASSAAAPRPVVSRPPLGADERATIELFERARGSVVYITTQTRVIDPWTRNIFSIPRGTGSGFVWDERGHIVTNYHVVSGASGARIRLSDGRDVTASPVGFSPAHDLAVLRVAVSNPPRPLPVGTSHDLQVGQKTFAIGNPFGLDWTLTTGIISALDRSLPTEDGRGLIQHLIQTDAAINPGNSGGPLLDSAGRLIGVNTAIYSPSGASAGVGFAVPVDTVNRVVPQLIAHGKYVRPALGIEVDEDLNRLVSARLGVTGVAVLRVRPGSGAAAAGLRGIRTLADGSVEPGDIIVALDGQPVDSVARLLGRLDDHAVGDSVRVTVVRGNTRREVTIRLQSGSE